MKAGRHTLQMAPYLRRLGWVLTTFGCGIVAGVILMRPTWTVPHLMATGVALAGLVVLMAGIHFVHELVATLDGVRYEMGQRRSSTTNDRRA